MMQLLYNPALLGWKILTKSVSKFAIWSPLCSFLFTFQAFTHVYILILT